MGGPAGVTVAQVHLREGREQHLDAHAPPHEAGALDALGREHGREVAHVAGDGVGAGALRPGALGGVEAAVVPAHEAVAVAEVVDLPAPHQGAAAEAAGEDDPRGAGVRRLGDVVGDLGPVKAPETAGVDREREPRREHVVRIRTRRRRRGPQARRLRGPAAARERERVTSAGRGAALR